ncbi:Peptide methionine sulfoxide reductase MsrA [Rosistilla ulvae]|uniref:Peptide methionine sulfoxide reductase MsrA n=1 Tax=Rosistilla ulvae TaxID=1930277 RepID=A0A517LY19_9BACT|nr:peptide-methionine (S)-S-oxide reductase MsrA [Rosistilla ulvae]QDS87513.1 Peptide methionine sulfoxide reductase MsrA [Rosistilla ulvae]
MRNLITMAMLIAVTAGVARADEPQNSSEPAAQAGTDNMQVATFGAGCFWCVEAVFQRLEGVEKIVSGYMGGRVPNPTYKMICTGRTGHAEVCQITFDPAKVSFDTLLEVFWKTHDPTTRNRQGNDVGTQYRSVIFYHNDEQKEIATNYKHKLNKANAFPGGPAVTEISEAEIFYPAEDYHQDYFNQNPGQGYCQFVVAPKVKKFQEIFGDKAKKE